jgi:hypothetical protein
MTISESATYFDLYCRNNSFKQSRWRGRLRTAMLNKALNKGRYRQRYIKQLHGSRSTNRKSGADDPVCM